MCLKVNAALTKTVRNRSVLSAYKLVLVDKGQLVPTWFNATGFVYEAGWNVAEGRTGGTRTKNVHGRAIHVFLNKEDALRLRERCFGLRNTVCVRVLCHCEDLIRAGYSFRVDAACYKKVWMDPADHQAALAKKKRRVR